MCTLNKYTANIVDSFLWLKSEMGLTKYENKIQRLSALKSASNNRDKMLPVFVYEMLRKEQHYALKTASTVRDVSPKP